MDIIALFILCAQMNRECTIINSSVSGEDAVVQSAINHDIPIELALAVAHQESRFDCDAQSSVGAVGVMQVMPKTAEYLGYDPTKLHDCEYGAEVGIKYLKQQLNRTNNDVRRALIAYNCGPNCRNPQNQETSNYVRKIMQSIE